MVAAVRVHKHGGPEVLIYEDIPVKDPGQGEARVKNTAIGLNYLDTYFRTGLYPAPGGFPFVVGSEGAGVVVAVGAGVTEFKGLIDTDIHASGGQPDRIARIGASVPLGRAGTAEETANAILWLLSDAASYVSGAILRVSGGR